MDILKKAPEPDLAGTRIAQSVAAHIEPVTRFDRGDLTQDAPDLPLKAPMALSLHQSVHFAVERFVGPRPLPGHISRLEYSAQLDAALQDELARASRDCDTALNAWVLQAPSLYRRVLPREAGFLRPPIPYGMQYSCVSCEGQCQVQCGSCAGVGNVSCASCAGVGVTNCSSCNGNPSKVCYGCGGGGTIAAHNMHNPNQRRPCPSCSGSGRLRCGCGNGQVTCGGCSGRGRCTCGGCGGAGRVDCEGCAASGVQHAWGIVSAEVSVADELSFGEVPPALQTVIGARIAPADLPAFGSYLGAAHSVKHQQLSSRYELSLEAAFATVRTSAQQFPLYGLGPDARVLDFGNIAGSLLENDLATLEQHGPQGTLWRLKPPGALLEAMQQFTESELNLLIAEQLTPAKDGVPASAAAVEAQFHSMVDSSYVQRADLALRTGFNGLYGNSFLVPALGLLLAVSLFEILIYTFGPNDLRLLGSMGWALLAGLCGWLLIEQVSLYRLVRHFPQAQHKRLRTQFKGASKLKRWRIGMALVLLLSTYWTAKLLAKHPGIFTFLRHGPAQVIETGASKPFRLP